MPSVLGCVFLSGTVNIIFASLSKKEKKKNQSTLFPIHRFDQYSYKWGNLENVEFILEIVKDLIIK